MTQTEEGRRRLTAKQAEAAHRQLESLASEIASLLQQSDRFVTLNVTFVVATIALLVHQEQWLLLCLTPLPGAMLFNTVNGWGRELRLRGGYRAALEEALNDYYGRPLHLWESAIVPRLSHPHYGFATNLFDVISVLSVTGAAGYGLYELTKTFHPAIRISSAVLLLAAIAALAVPIARGRRADHSAFDEAYELACERMRAGREVEERSPA